MRVGGVVRIDVGAHVGQEVGAVAGFEDGTAQAGELVPVRCEDFAVPREVVLF